MLRYTNVTFETWPCDLCVNIYCIYIYIYKCVTVPASFASDGSDLENDNASCTWACKRAHGGKKLDMLTWQVRHDAMLRHQICPPCTFSALLSHIPSDASFSINALMHAMHSAAPPVYALGSASCLSRACKAFHVTILNLFNTTRSCLPCMLLANCCIHWMHFRKDMLLRASSPVFECFCSTGFVRFCFCFFLPFFCYFFIWRLFVHFWFCGFLFVVFVFCKILHFPVFENFSFWSHVANSLFLRISRSGWIGHDQWKPYTCPGSIAGVPFNSVRRFRATLLLRTTCMRVCCNWFANCVAA